ncbi:hypothetical protein RRG08_043664 [Elysia crispata]|uniref:Uncharacterized protein n=1 Tax=Elysia crispata TaxID=231223 RepID=A0AAE1DMF0_9GAST|nr:hypothetical protein RRG08_043664 [Elysia crispata]
MDKNLAGPFKHHEMPWRMSFSTQEERPSSWIQSLGLAGTGEKEKLVKLVNRRDKITATFSSDVSRETIKLMTDNIGGTYCHIRTGDKELETVRGFKGPCVTTHELTRRILPERTLRVCAPGDSPSAKDRAAYDKTLRIRTSDVLVRRQSVFNYISRSLQNKLEGR